MIDTSINLMQKQLMKYPILLLLFAIMTTSTVYAHNLVFQNKDAARKIVSFNNGFVDQNLADRDLLEEQLRNQNEDTSFHLFSHGQSGTLFLNNQWLSGDDLVAFIQPLLQDKTQLNIYGCHFAQGEKGRTAVEFLEAALGVAVAASDDVTGIDGDWNLEVGVGCNALKILDYPNNLQQCGTILSASDLTHSIPSDYNSNTANKNSVANSIPLNMVIIRDDSGNGGVSQNQVIQGVENLNTDFQGTDFGFYVANLSFVNNSTYSSFTQSEGNAAYALYGNPDYLTVFVTDVENVNGFARFPFWTDNRYLAVDNTRLLTNTLAHEIGHYLGLYHTHENYNGNELVDGSNCGTAADMLCDTPADPLVDYTTLTANCDYTGTATDANGSLYMPLTNNFMSYAPHECRTAFTADQIGLMTRVFILILITRNQESKNVLAFSYN